MGKLIQMDLCQAAPVDALKLRVAETKALAAAAVAKHYGLRARTREDDQPAQVVTSRTCQHPEYHDPGWWDLDDSACEHGFEYRCTAHDGRRCQECQKSTDEWLERERYQKWADEVVTPMARALASPEGLDEWLEDVDRKLPVQDSTPVIPAGVKWCSRSENPGRADATYVSDEDRERHRGALTTEADRKAMRKMLK